MLDAINANEPAYRPCVTIVSNDFPPIHGGIQRYISALAERIVERKVDVRVIAPDRAGSRAFDESVLYSVLRYRGSSLQAHFIGMLRTLLRPGLEGSAFTVASLWFPAGLACLLVPRRIRGKLIVLVHGAELQPSRKGLRRLLLRLVLNRADAVVANSTFTASMIRRCGVTRDVEIVNCGVDVFDIDRLPSAEPTILAVGRLVRRKGFDRLLRSLPEVFLRFPRARCVIVGEGPMRLALEADAFEMGIADHVQFMGAVDDSSLRAAYASAWCFALPVRNDGDDVEGFGIVYLEAAIAGLPSVGGLASGAEDAISDGETGILVDGDDHRAIARALIYLLSNPQRAEAMGRAGRTRALRDFTWSRCADRILEIAL